MKRRNAKEDASMLNTLRLALGNSILGKDAFIDALSKYGLPRNVNYWQALLKCEVISGKYNKYYFKNPETPVHYSKVEHILDIYRGYNHFSNKDNIPLDIKIRQAIDLLKNNGYKVMKPKTTYEEV